MIQWPPHSKIYCFNSSDEVIGTSKRSRLDLSDTLMLRYNGTGPLKCTIEVSTKDLDWKSWNSDNVSKVESYIQYDLEFDGYSVKIYRLSTPNKTLCSKPFKWGLEISADDEPLEMQAPRSSTGSRHKVARSDASIKTIQSSIEKIFGLPGGSVCLLTPEDKKANPRSSIKKLRNRWKNG